MPVDLSIAALQELIEEIAKRGTAYVVVVYGTPDHPDESRCWWDGKVWRINWMLDQAKASLHCTFPPHECSPECRTDDNQDDD